MFSRADLLTSELQRWSLLAYLTRKQILNVFAAHANVGELFEWRGNGITSSSLASTTSHHSGRNVAVMRQRLNGCELFLCGVKEMFF